MVPFHDSAAMAPFALEALSAGVLVVPADTGRVAFANPAAARILGRDVGALKGMRVEDLLAPVAQLSGSPRSATDTRPDLRIVLPHGDSTEVGFTVTSFRDPSDGLQRYVILFQEITGLRDLRRERDRLLRLAAVGEALPSVLHELRNPLAAMSGLIEVLLEEPGAPYAKELHAVLSEARRMALTLQGIGGLVRSARTERATAIDMAVRDACCILEPMAQRKGIELRAVGANLPLLRLDRDVISGVVFNLVKNAIDACDEGDLITVDARIEPGDVLALEVSDNGPGMPLDVQANCRDLFFTTKEKGSGIGLSLCERFAEASGGDLTIDTAPGRGTAITLRFPFDERRDRAAHVPLSRARSVNHVTNR